MGMSVNVEKTENGDVGISIGSTALKQLKTLYIRAVQSVKTHRQIKTPKEEFAWLVVRLCRI